MTKAQPLGILDEFSDFSAQTETSTDRIGSCSGASDLRLECPIIPPDHTGCRFQKQETQIPSKLD